jgi:hypothetical protein
MEQLPQQVANRTGHAVGQAGNAMGNAMNTAGNVASKVFNNMKAYWQFWIIGALIVYIFFFCGCSTESFYDVDWEQLGPAQRSFGRTTAVAELNDAVWDPDCRPNGEFYVMRYTHPERQGCMHSAKKRAPIVQGHFNACGVQL